MTFNFVSQSKAIPVVLSGKDALIKSQTGSGKTLAYAVPILHKLQVQFLMLMHLETMFFSHELNVTLFVKLRVSLRKIGFVSWL